MKNCKRLVQRRKEDRNLPKLQLQTDIDYKKIKLSCFETKEAEIVLLKYLQEEIFSTNESKLSSFKTFTDENGLIVLKTKIFNRKDTFTFLCPILLDKHDIVEMMIREIHQNCSHSGTQVVMNNVRERFWVISLRKILKTIISKCIVCKKQKVKSFSCETPPFPLNRVRDARIFEISGVDFASPIYFKGGGKGWICIFTCAVYRAVHLELVSELSTNKFIECLRRFIARRGRPEIIYFDNGTNFKGTSNLFNTLD